MKIVGVIPARFGSTRFEGKPLKLISGKPLIQWVIEAAKTSKSLSQLFVATDDERIQKFAERCGVKAVMTDSALPSGSDRVWAAVKDVECDYVLNIQGDEPLITGAVLDTLAEAFRGVSPPEMATLARPIKNHEELTNQNTAKLVLNHLGNALYFSRSPIPFSKKGEVEGHLKHIGLYGYSKAFLGRFCKQGPVDLEKIEGLEQLRALYMGAQIKVVLTEYESWGVDHPEDVLRVEAMLKRSGK